MFKVDTEILKSCSVKLNMDSEALKTESQKVEEVRSVLEHLGGMEIVAGTLQTIIANLSKEAAMTESLAQSLGRISYKYESSESRILGQIESGSSKLSGNNVSLTDYTDKSAMNDSAKETLKDIDKLIN